MLGHDDRSGTRHRRDRAQHHRSDLPTPERLARCLDALADTVAPDLDIEVVVVDDGSRIAPTALVDAVADRLDIRLHSQTNTGPAAARNTGASLARHRWLAFTDDDCAPRPDWPARSGESRGCG